MLSVIVVIVLLATALFADAALRRWEAARTSEGARTRHAPYTPRSHKVSESAGCRVLEGALYHPGHLWVVQDGPRRVKIGLDDLALNVLEPIDAWHAKTASLRLTQGAPELCFSTAWGNVALPSPVDGDILEESADPSTWLLSIRLDDPADCLRNLIAGDRARGWMRDEVARLNELLDPHGSLTRLRGLPDLEDVGETQRSVLAVVLLNAESVPEIAAPCSGLSP